ncbi:MAG TPA: LuxR C-terminal-related transcriptional regulator [Solirubrobacteraceae bacterium]|jgi:DNA-binding NarL/FixJ family response regulator|nr:LuxR C-terminal-related transcriptional regulator [Solirubrobacteraceae bacterium]
MGSSGQGAQQLVETWDAAQAASEHQAGADRSLVYLRAAPGAPARPPAVAGDGLERRMHAVEERASELSHGLAATRAMLELVERRLDELREVEARVETLRADLESRERAVVRRAKRPCPLTSRELEMVVALSDGKVYKQIAHEMSLSASTVRSHLHHAYVKLGVSDRAQAVLLATKRGWI